MIVRIEVAVAAGLALLAACGGSRQETGGGSESGAASEQAVWKPTGDEGSIKGQVRFDGQAPKMKPLSMDADSVCAGKHKGPVYPETVVANKNGTLRNVFVYVKSGLEGKTFGEPSEPAELDQDGCMYKPHVLGMRARQGLKVVTSDDTTHNIHPMPKVNQEWNVSQPPKADPIMKAFNRPEVSIPVKCNQHPWMKAWIHVMSHPYFAVTGEDGSYEIKDLPPGNYEIEAVHEQYGAQTQKVTVAAKQPAAADFSYKSSVSYKSGSLKVLPAMVLHCCEN
jgi:hypothetical protein